MKCFQAAEQYFMDPVLSYWMSGLIRADNNDPIWTWAYCKLEKGSQNLNKNTLAGQKVPPSWSNWNEMAVPNITGHNLNCMQYLSGTAYGKQENTKSSEKNCQALSPNPLIGPAPTQCFKNSEV